MCSQCLDEIRPVEGRVCRVCGERLVSEAMAEPLCGECRFEAPRFHRALAYGPYDGGLRDLIHLLKYERVRPAAAVLGRMLAEVMAELAKDFGTDVPVVVPIPLHTSKTRQRGFNQSEMVTDAALKLVRHDLPRLVRIPGILERVRPTESQTGLTLAQRRENMRGAFRVAQPALVAARAVLLVDDVFTTGTTVSEAARVLRRAGAGKIWVATLARAQKRQAAIARADSEAELPARSVAVAAGG